MDKLILDQGVLRQAFEETLEVLGSQIRQALMADLDSHLRESDDAQDLELSTISECLRRYFGLDSAEMIMERTMARMHELSSVGVSNSTV